jgi:hypothetical protein
VAGPKTLPDILLLGQGQKTARGGYAAVLYDQGAVMQGAVKFKYRDNQRRGEIRVDPCSRINNVFNIGAPGKNHQGPTALLGEQFRSGYRSLKLAQTGFIVQVKEIPLAYAYDDFPQFGLEHYGYGDKEPRGDNVEGPLQGSEPKNMGHAVHKGKVARALDQLQGLGLFEEVIGFVKKKGKDGNIQNRPYKSVQCGKPLKPLHFRRL